MMDGDDYGVTCLGCDKTSWADPFTGKFNGPHAMKSESFIVEAKKKAAKKKAKKPVAKKKKKPAPGEFTKRMDKLDADNHKKYGSPSGWGKKDKQDS